MKSLTLSNLLMSGTPNRGCTPDNGPTMDRQRTDNGPITLRKFAVALCLLLTICVGSVWGANIVIDLDLTQSSTYPGTFPTADGTSSGTYTFGGYSFSFSCNNNVKRGGNSNGSYYILIGKAGAAENNASVITFPAIENYKLTEVKLTVATSSGVSVKAYIGSSYGSSLSGGDEWTFVKTSPNNVKTWSLTGTAANTAYKMYIVRASGSNTYNGQLAGLKLTYEQVGGASCTDAPTVTAPSNGSFLWTAYFIARKPFCRAA